jgi:drug/metabolite transporter (DMT)-like permease
LLSLEKNGEDKSNMGILTMIIATICFSLMAAMVKFLRHLPVMEIIFFRNIPIMLIIPLILKNKKISFWGNNKPLLLLRSLFSSFAAIAFFYTITVMILTDAVTIKQLSPFFIILLASIFLGETIDFRKITFFILAFLGALLVVKPGFRLDIYPAIIALLGAISTAGSHVALRSLRLTDHPLVIVNYFGYSIGLISFGILLWQGNFIIPDVLSLFVLLLLGLAGLGGQFALTKAYQMAPTKLVSLYLYLQIIFGALLGVLFFKEIPDLLSVFGASLIIISGYLNYKLKIE